MAISKITLNGVTQMDVTGKTVTSSSMLNGVTALKNDGTDITGSITSKTSSDLTVSGATVTAPAGYYGSAATKSVTSGTAGTPTATKGTVSNHAISVTPSVTNTTGYIEGGTKTGTAVSVSASELVSGSETKTSNGTYDVTNLAQIVVNVSGGGSGGLEYEEGTWTPATDIARGTISFSKTHTDMPVYVMLSDATDSYSDTTYSGHLWIYADYWKTNGSPIYQSTTSINYARVVYVYRSTGTTSLTSSYRDFTVNSDDTSDGSAMYPRYWVNPSGFNPYLNSSSTYWRSGRTYKWIAVWAPTT